MKEKNALQKESKSNKGMEKLLGVHTKALENNSKSIIEILELLSSKDLSVADKKALKKIKREISSIDKSLDSLGNEKNENGRDWFEF